MCLFLDNITPQEDAVLANFFQNPPMIVPATATCQGQRWRGEQGRA